MGNRLQSGFRTGPTALSKLMPVGAHIFCCVWNFVKSLFMRSMNCLASESSYFYIFILFINIYYFDPHEAVCQRVSEPVDLTNS